MGSPLVLLVRGVFFLLNLLPLRVRIGVLHFFVRLGFLLIPRLTKTSLRNLEIAFPEQTLEWRREVLNRSKLSLARLFVDFARLPLLDKEWVDTHIECRYFDEHRDMMSATEGGPGVLTATGHLGSFELIAHYSALKGCPSDFIVRSSKTVGIDAWWTAQRERNGSRVIPRRGAVKRVISSLFSGRNVGILFDQNVTAEHAVFVPWFGKLAATSRTVGIAAVRVQPRVMVASIHYLGDDRYRIDMKRFDFSALYADATLTTDEKVERITAELSHEFEQRIRAHPEEWFWMHRRWRTRPPGEPSLYR